jgi:hypothetical protein
MALSDIRAFLANRLASITNHGIILQYEPIATRPQAILEVFGGDQTVKSWSIALQDANPTVEEQLTNIEVLRKHTFALTLWMTVTNPAITEPQVEALSEAAMAVFRRVIQTGAPEHIERSLPMQRVDARHVMLGDTLLVHYWRHTLEVWELMRLGQ